MFLRLAQCLPTSSKAFFSLAVGIQLLTQQGLRLQACLQACTVLGQLVSHGLGLCQLFPRLGFLATHFTPGLLRRIGRKPRLQLCKVVDLVTVVLYAGIQFVQLSLCLFLFLHSLAVVASGCAGTRLQCLQPLLHGVQHPVTIAAGHLAQRVAQYPLKLLMGIFHRPVQVMTFALLDPEQTRYTPVLRTAGAACGHGKPHHAGQVLFGLFTRQTLCVDAQVAAFGSTNCLLNW